MKQKAILYCGHFSPYAHENLKALMCCNAINVQEIVLADAKRWEIFKTAIAGKKTLVSGKVFKEKTKRVNKLVNGAADIRVIHNANCLFEYNLAKEFDIVISVAYPQIFSLELIQAPKNGAINFHPSYLPRCRGAHPVYWTVANQEDYGGITCHFMTEKLDQGPIIARRKIEFDKQSITYKDLYKAIKKDSSELVKQVDEFFEDEKTAIDQENNFSYFRNDREVHRKVYFALENSSQISAKIRAGGAFAFDPRGFRINFYPEVKIMGKSEYVTNNYLFRIESGTILWRNQDSMEIKLNGVVMRCNYSIEVTFVLRLLFRLLRKKYLPVIGGRAS